MYLRLSPAVFTRTRLVISNGVMRNPNEAHDADHTPFVDPGPR
jgi:hypothetical protein